MEGSRGPNSKTPSMEGSINLDLEFPCSLRIDVPLPTERLAQAAKKALQVDQELSPLVRRSFSIIAPAIPSSNAANSLISPAPEQTIFRTEYKATTNRMLRVAVNGFMESLGVVLGIMEELDVDVLEMKAQSGRVDEVG